MTVQPGSKKKCIKLLFQLSEEKERSWEPSNEEEENISSAKKSKKFETIIYPSEYVGIYLLLVQMRVDCAVGVKPWKMFLGTEF